MAEQKVAGGTIDFEEVLAYFGPFARHSRYVFALACLASFMCGQPVVQDTFVSYLNPSRCVVPGCDNNATQYNESFVEWAIPQDDEDDRECRVRQRQSNQSLTCDQDDFLNDTEKCSDWVYDTSLFHSSTVTEFDLTCDRAWLAPWSGSMYMIGMLLGAITIGSLADSFGRRMGMMVSVMLLGGGGALAAVSPNYIMFLFMRLLTGAGGVGLFQLSFIIAVEFVGTKWRTFAGIIIEVPFALGEATTGVLAIFIRDWRWLQLALTAPAFLLLSYYWLMPESVRWLVAQGRRRDAVEVIKKAAKFNRVEYPKHLIDDAADEPPTISGTLSAASSSVQLVQEAPPVFQPERRTVLDLLRTPNMRKRSLNMFYCWAVCTLAFYGLSANSGNLAGNVFVNFIATMLIEIPSHIFSYLVLDRMGRKGTLSFVLLLGGVACFISAFIPEDIGWLIVTLSLVGKFGISAAFAIVFVYAAELFPNDCRSVGIGACSMCARVGGILAPLIASLSSVYPPLPLLIFGVLSIIAGALVVLLPETAGCELPQTLQQSEEFGTDQSIWYFTCFGSKDKRTRQ